MNKILVAYATKYGATAEIAAKIGQVLDGAGLQADVVPVKQVKDLEPYGAAVLGSSIYIGAWRKELVKFLNDNEKWLADHPLWLFSSGPMGPGDPVELLKGWKSPKKLQPLLDRIKPRDVAVFHGAVDTQKMNAFEKWAIKNIKAPTGDFRDWDKISAWARGIADQLDM